MPIYVLYLLRETRLFALPLFFLRKFSICVPFFWVFLLSNMITPSTAWGEIQRQGKWLFGLQGGISIFPEKVGKGNGAVTEGFPGPVVNGRLLYGITDKMLVGIDLEWERHKIVNRFPVPLYFGRSSTVSSMGVIKIYSPFGSFFRRYPALFPYGLIGLGFNKNSLAESSSFSESCNPASSCSVRL